MAQAKHRTTETEGPEIEPIFQEAKTVEQFNELNKDLCIYLINLWVFEKRSTAEELYHDFIISLQKHKTLSRFNPQAAKFQTYISRCLRNFLCVAGYKKGTDRLIACSFEKEYKHENGNSSSVEDTLSTEDTGYEVSDVQKDLLKFKAFYKGVLQRQIASTKPVRVRRGLENELRLVDLFYRGLEPSQVIESLGLQGPQVYFYRKKMLAFYKSWLNNN